jgi:hypothetical protein
MPRDKSLTNVESNLFEPPKKKTKADMKWEDQIR